MRVRENQALSCEPVEVGRGDSAVAVENPYITISHVIGEDDEKDDENVRSACLTRRRRNAFLCGDEREQEPAGESE